MNDEYLAHQLKASDAAGGIGNVTKVIRMLLQSAVLGLGAYLVIKSELSAGAIIAASITVSRSLAPIESAIGHWKSFVSARISAKRLGDLLTGRRRRRSATVVDLPAPQHQLQVEAAGCGAARPARSHSAKGYLSHSITATRSASSARAAPANQRSRAHSSASGSR